METVEIWGSDGPELRTQIKVLVDTGDVMNCRADGLTAAEMKYPPLGWRIVKLREDQIWIVFERLTRVFEIGETWSVEMTLKRLRRPDEA